MIEAVLTPDRILDATEEVLARHGPAKTNVVDVARVLGVSHGTVYRHFPSKTALRDAVTERWLHRVTTPLRRIVDEDAPAKDRLRRWFDALIAMKREKARAEPELFATYHAIVSEQREVIQAHIEELSGQIAAIIADGVARGEFVSSDPASTGTALFYATARFHNPAYASEWNEPGVDKIFEDLWTVLVRGLMSDV